MAFDGTYLTKTLAQLSLHGKAGIVGGAWEVSSAANSWVSLEQEAVNVKNIPKAANMIEFLVWDPAAPNKVGLPVCSLPMQANYGGVHSTKRGQWLVLELVGKVLQGDGKIVRGIVYDAHSSHLLVRKVMHGQLQDVDLEAVSRLPFFSSVRHVPLPPNCLPRLPIELCYLDRDVIYSMPGPCFLATACYSFDWAGAIWGCTYIFHCIL